MILCSAEIKRLIAPTTASYRGVATLLAYSGLRVSEAAGLIWENVELVERTIHVRKRSGANFVTAC